MKTDAGKGLSVIVCCYNSRARLPKTLEALSAQQYHRQLAWELIIVDNASTDGTLDVAKNIWNSFKSPIPLQAVKEPLPGLAHARRKGVAVANFSFLLFCDDDNWLGENYIQGVFDILSSSDSIAACGGMGIPVFETKEPFWFYEYAEAFAVGSQEILCEGGRQLSLYGAGMGVRKDLLENIYDSDFKPFFSGRKGNSLSSSEDTELTSIFVLQGFQLVYSDELKFHHFLPKERLESTYLRKLFSAFGKDGPLRNLYYSYISRRMLHRMLKSWFFHFLISLYRLVKYFIIPPKRYGRTIYMRWNAAYIRQLIYIRGDYQVYKKAIAALSQDRAVPHSKQGFIEGKFSPVD